MRVGKVGVSVLLCFASAWTCAMHLRQLPLRKTSLRTQPPLKAQGCRNTEVAAAFVKPDDLCMGVGVSELSAFGLGVVNDPNALILCAPSCRGPIYGRFLGDAANTDAAANQMTSEEHFTFIPCPIFSRGIWKQNRVRPTSMLTSGQVPQRTSIPQTHFPLRALGFVLTALSVWMR
jgi:hypothetical protein